MLEKYLDQLMFEMRDATIFQLAPSSEDRAVWEKLPEAYRRKLSDRAVERMGESIPSLFASDYMRFRKEGDRSAYSKPYRTRRDMLCDAVMGAAVDPSDKWDARLVDLIWSICEESSWVLPINNPLAMGTNSLPLPDIYEPLVDSAAADTAADLCMAVQVLGEKLYALTPQLIQRVVYEIDRRIITPFLAARDMGWMCGSKGEAAQCLRGVMMAFLSFEQDDHRRWTCMKKSWGILDRMLRQLPPDGSIPGGMSEWFDTVSPIMDCLEMTRIATGGKIDLRRELQIQLMCHFPVLCHIAQGWFINPGAQTMQPALSGEAVYRIGIAAYDGALCDLGAFLFHEQREGGKVDSERLLLHRCQNALLRARLEEEKSRPPFRRQGYLGAQQLMVARAMEDDEHGLALAVHGGSNGQINGHMDVGDVTLFAHGMPVLVDAGCFEETSRHCLPVIAGREQLSGALHRAENVTWQLEEDFATLSMSLGGLYPKEAHLIDWQRTAVYNRDDGTVQLIDIFDLSSHEMVQFHFMTPCKPSLGDKFAQIGPVRMRWEDGLDVSVDSFEVTDAECKKMWGPTLYRLTLMTKEPVDRGEYTFTFNALRTFG